MHIVYSLELAESDPRAQHVVCYSEAVEILRLCLFRADAHGIGTRGGSAGSVGAAEYWTLEILSSRLGLGPLSLCIEFCDSFPLFSLSLACLFFFFFLTIAHFSLPSFLLEAYFPFLCLFGRGVGLYDYTDSFTMRPSH